MTENKKKLEKDLFLACIIFTIFHIVSLVSVSFGCNEILHSQTLVYTFVLAGYVGVKRAHRWGKENDDQKKGEYFLYLLLLTALIIFMFQRFTNSAEFKVSKQLAPTIEYAFMIFLGSKFIRDFSPAINERLKK